MNKEGSISEKIFAALFITVLIWLLFSCKDRTSDEYIHDGIEHTKDQEYEKAVVSFKKAIELDYNNALAHYSLGGIYTFKDMNDMAIAEYRKAIEIDPTYPDPHYSLGFVYEKTGREKEAKQEYRLFELLKN